MRVLAITPLFPNRREPRFGPFNRQQFAALSEIPGVSLKVLCSVPYVPFSRLAGAPKRAALLADLPPEDVIDGMQVRYMKRLYVPAVGTPVALPLYWASLAPHHALLRWADVILSTWAFPDGCAAVALARAMGTPVVVKVHGSDVNVIAKMRAARPQVRAILPHAQAIATVSRAMGHELARAGVPEERICLVPNGINPGVFFPRDRGAARTELGLPMAGKVIVFVGRLEREKGVLELLQAFRAVAGARPDTTLCLLGEVIATREVEQARAEFGSRLLTPGPQPLERIATYLAACNLFTLPSHREGTPNVVLEALASGRPVVASDVGGIPDVVPPEAGLLVPAKDSAQLARALLSALDRDWATEAVASHGPVPWAESARTLHSVLCQARRGAAH